MDKDRIKGKVEDIKGRVKRQAGEWTGDSDLQVEGTAEQLKGKVQNTVGKAKDAARDIEQRGATRWTACAARRTVRPKNRPKSTTRDATAIAA